MKQPLRVLLAEDNPHDAELILYELRRAGFEPDLHRVETEKAFVAGLDNRPDIVLSDYVMPQFAAPRALELLKEHGPDIPFILVSGTIGEDVAVAAIRLGASDYLLKDRLARLGPAVNNALEENRLRSAQRQAEVALRDSALLTNDVLNSLTANVTVLNARGKIIAVNAAWQRFSSENATPLQCRDASLGADYFLVCAANNPAAKGSLAVEQALAGIRAVLEGKKPVFSMDYPCDSPTQKRWFSMRVSALGGRQRGVVIAHEDVSERYRLEEQFRQAQKMETVGQLAGGVAHDFNNILTVVQGYATLLQQEAISPAEAAHEISIAVARGAGLSRQLLTFSRQQVMQMKELDLNDVVAETTKMLGRILGDSITLVVESSLGLPSITADQGMIEQILMNLSVNARDAMPQGGRLTITTETMVIDEAEAQSHPEAMPGPAVSLRVSDTGTGMPPDVLARVFEPFFTTKETHKGTGLGLANVQGIVKQHRGWIKLVSTVGKGTTFQIILPANASKIQAPRAPRVELPGSIGGHETILLVDDEPALRLVVTHALKHLGYRIIEANSGREALSIFEQNLGKIDLLFTDLVMPDGVTGKVLAERLRARQPALRVLYSSGYSGDTLGRTMSIPEGFHFLQKPYTAQVLAQAVRGCLDS